MKNLRLLFLVIIVLFASCATNDKEEKTPKYIFYFIGDGFGLAHSQVAEKYLQETQGDTCRLVMNSFSDIALYSTFCSNRYITGSAAAGTALSTGEKTTVNTIGMADDKKTPLKNIAEKYKEKGYKVGIITSVSIDHATPAAFYAHQPSRNMYYNISLELSKSGFNYFAGGDFIHPDGDGEINDKDLAANIGLAKGTKVSDKPSSLEIAKQNGYRIIKSREDFKNLKNGEDKLICFPTRLQGGNTSYYSIDQSKEDLTLVDFTSKGIEVLDNQQGFFMMIEGGKIDWAAHANCISTVVKDVLQFDEAISKALEFYKKHPDETLIVVCGDHETGGLAMSSNTMHYESNYSLLKHQDMSYEEFGKLIDKLRIDSKGKASFNQAMILLEEHFGLGNKIKGLELSELEINQLKEAYKYSMMDIKPKNDESYMMKYAYYEPFTVTACHILAEKVGVSWGSFNHTASPLPVRAIGVGSELFEGMIDNTDIPNIISKISGI